MRTVAIYEVCAMMGMGFLRLGKVLKKHKWTPSRGNKEIEAARRKEDILLTVIVVLFLGLLFSAVIFSGRF